MVKRTSRRKKNKEGLTIFKRIKTISNKVCSKCGERGDMNYLDVYDSINKKIIYKTILCDKCAMEYLPNHKTFSKLSKIEWFPIGIYNRFITEIEITESVPENTNISTVSLS